MRRGASVTMEQRCATRRGAGCGVEATERGVGGCRGVREGCDAPQDDLLPEKLPLMTGCGDSVEVLIVEDPTNDTNDSNHREELLSDENRTNSGLPMKMTRSVEEVPLVDVCSFSTKIVNVKVVPKKSYPVEVVLQGGSAFSAQDSLLNECDGCSQQDIQELEDSYKKTCLERRGKNCIIISVSGKPPLVLLL